MFAAFVFSPALFAQVLPDDQPKAVGEALAKRKWNNSPPVKSYYAGKKSSAPAPRKDLSGIWDGWVEGGTQGGGMHDHIAGDNGNKIWGQADESGIEHPLPYTPAGLAALQAHKPGVGVRSVPAALANDPVNAGNPPGFPRMFFYELRVIELVQARNRVIFLDQFGQHWRSIWTDGRLLPGINDVEPRWFGYSAGKWTDDYTFEADTVGVDEKTWLDNAGRPHSYEMRVHETWHRVDYDTLELTVTVDDPQYYSAKWDGLNKFVLHRLPDDFDMEECIYNATETTEYDNSVANDAIGPVKP